MQEIHKTVQGRLDALLGTMEGLELQVKLGSLLSYVSTKDGSIREAFEAATKLIENELPGLGTVVVNPTLRARLELTGLADRYGNGEKPLENAANVLYTAMLDRDWPATDFANRRRIETDIQRARDVWKCTAVVLAVKGYPNW